MYELFYWPQIQGRGEFIRLALEDVGAPYDDVARDPARGVAAIRALLDASLVKGMAHITGGGITENLPRIFPEGCSAEIDRASWSVPPLFRFIAERGGIADAEMLRAFNMGVGMIVTCDTATAAQIRDLAMQAGVDSWMLGHLRPGSGRVHLV